MEECVYFTNRDIGESGHVLAWVFRDYCPECGKELMQKPTDKKGKVKVRAKEYVCPACGFSLPKEEFEPRLVLNVAYTCPHCGHEGEKQAPYKRKKIKGVDTIRVECDSCKKNIDITKKMKDPKA